jgi:nicotinate-nucleotide adenylyltransferase
MNWNGKINSRVGVFGGTFDPPHIGHLILAAEAVDQLDLDKVFWVLTPNPPHKPDWKITALDFRLRMLQAAISDNETFELSDIDINRPPPHFALETVELLREKNPAKELIYLMGGDSLVSLPSWNRPKEFINDVDVLGVMCRPGSEIDLSKLDSILPGVQEKVRFIQAPLLNVSSSELRSRIYQGQGFRYYVQPQVYKFILEHKLYQ